MNRSQIQFFNQLGSLLNLQILYCTYIFNIPKDTQRKKALLRTTKEAIKLTGIGDVFSRQTCSIA